jgi:hypothetical protein
VSIAAAPRPFPDCSVPGPAPVIRVGIVAPARPPGAGLWKRPLGAIAFGIDGAPAPVISLFLGDIVRLVAGVRVLGALEAQWPAEMRERIIGRVIGRVLAHEIGHYLLRTPRHGSAGLMRPVHLTPTLVGQERRAFTLSKSEAAHVAFQAETETAR